LKYTVTAHRSKVRRYCCCQSQDADLQWQDIHTKVKVSGTGKVIPVLNEVPRHGDISIFNLATRYENALVEWRYSSKHS